jgi:hypothetical protein
LNNRCSSGNISVSDKIFVDYSKGVVIVSELVQKKLLVGKIILVNCWLIKKNPPDDGIE